MDGVRERLRHKVAAMRFPVGHVLLIAQPFLVVGQDGHHQVRVDGDDSLAVWDRKNQTGKGKTGAPGAQRGRRGQQLNNSDEEEESDSDDSDFSDDEREPRFLHVFSTDKEVLKLKDRGNAFFKRGEYAKAQACYYEGLKSKLFGKQIALLRLRAACAMNMGHFVSALADATAVLL